MCLLQVITVSAVHPTIAAFCMKECGSSAKAVMTPVVHLSLSRNHTCCPGQLPRGCVLVTVLALSHLTRFQPLMVSLCSTCTGSNVEILRPINISTGDGNFDVGVALWLRSAIFKSSPHSPAFLNVSLTVLIARSACLVYRG